MVRVGGGWDTLDHFLLKHDPCRLRSISGMGMRPTLCTRPMLLLSLPLQEVGA